MKAFARSSILLLAAAVAPLIGLSGCTQTREPGPMIEVPAGSFVQGWESQLQLNRGDKVAALDVVGDQLLVRTTQNVVYGISADGGTLRWSSQVLAPGRTLGRPVLVGDKIVFPTTGELIIYNVRGTREQELNLKRAIRSPIATDGEFVYLGFDHDGQGRLGRVSLTAPYLPIRWELMSHGAISAAPAVFQNVIYSAGEDGHVVAVTEQRLPIWPLPGNVFVTGGPIRADLRVDDSALYVASSDSRLYAVDRVTGKVRWQYFATAPLMFPPMIRGDAVYQFVPGKGVVALDRTGGQYNREPRWVAETAIAALSADANYAYLLADDATIFAVDQKTGEPVFKTQRTDLQVFAETPASRPLIYAATRDGLILGIKPQKTGGAVGRVVSLPASVPLGG